MNFTCRLVFSGLLLSLPVFAADTLHLQLAALHSSYLNIDVLEVQYGTAESSRPGLWLRMEGVQSPLLTDTFNVELRCPQADYSHYRLSCSGGEAHLLGSGSNVPLAVFSFDINLLDHSADVQVQVTTTAGELKAEYRANARQQWHLELEAKRLLLPQIARLLAKPPAAFNTLALNSGKLTVDAQVQGQAETVQSVSLHAVVDELGIEGESVAEGLGLQVQTSLHRDARSWSFSSSLQFDKGEMYIQPGLTVLGTQPGFYLALDTTPVALDMRGKWTPQQDLLELESVSYRQPATLALQGSARISLQPAVDITELALQLSIDDLARAYPVYLQPLLIHSDFSELELSGGLDVHLAYKDAELRRLELSLREVYLDELHRRFSVSGLHGELRLHDQNEVQESTLAWRGMSFYRLDFGPGEILFESSGEEVRVLHWKDVAVFDGALHIDEFSMRKLGSPEFELRLGGKLLPISMKTLTHALGWTVFPGELSGEISGLKFSRNSLSLHGDLQVRLFEGLVNIRNLQVDNLFSTYSVLRTDISFERLNLEQITDVFTFGKIEGSLSGSMSGLRLEDWQPAYFEAEFASPLDDDKAHRISQKALENLNTLGGGLGGTLSRGFLRFLPAYSYGRLGVSCRLVNGICELGGVEDNGEEFAILTRGGLLPPWVEVKGRGRSIKWDELVNGLKQIAEGEVTIE